MGGLEEALATWMAVARTAYERDLKYPAAALAYYAFVSLVPLLLLVFAVLGEEVATRIHEVMPRFLTIEAQQLVYEATTEATGRAGASLLAIGVLVWSGANVVVGVQTVVARVEGAPERSRRKRLRDAAAILGSLLLAIVSIVVTSALFAQVPGGAVFAALALPVALTGAFLPLYYVPSRLVTAPTAALPGAVTAAVGWTVVHNGVRLYVLNAGQYAIYGVLSGVIVILTSLYLAAVLLLTGVIVNAMVADEAAVRTERDTGGVA